MVLGYRLIDICSFWRPNIRIVKIAIRFSTTVQHNYAAGEILAYLALRVKMVRKYWLMTVDLPNSLPLHNCTIW